MRKIAAAVCCSLALACPAVAAARDSDAEIVSETIEVQVTNPHTALESGTRVIRVLTPAGIDEAAFAIPVFPFTEVNEIRATLTRPDGTKQDLEPANLIEQPLFGQAVAQETKILRGSFPGVTVGSTVKVSWRRTLRSLLYVDDWVFKGHLPIVQSTYRLIVPLTFPVRWAVKNGETTPRETEEGVARTYTFEVSKSPPIEREMFAPSLDNLAGRVQFFFPAFDYGDVSLDLASWQGVASFYHEIASDRQILGSALASEIKAEAKKLKSPRAIIAAMLERLTAFRYVQVYLGMGGYQPHAAAWTIERRYGDCKDLATVLVGMLRAASVEAYPMLTRLERGYRFLPEFPSPRQFNHCVVYVPLPDGPVVLDATAPAYPPGVLPSALAGAPGLVIRDDGSSELLTLPAGQPELNRTEVVLDLAAAAGGATAGGGMSGSFTARLTGDGLASGVAMMETGRQRLDAGEAAYVLPSIRQSRLQGVTFERSSDALLVAGTVDTAIAPGRAGRDRLLAAAMLLEDGRARAFGAATRRQPIDLGDADLTSYRIRYQTSGATRCFAPFSVDGTDGSYKVSCTAAAGEVVIERTLIVMRPWIEPSDYAEARTFWSAVLRGDRLAAVIAEAP